MGIIVHICIQNVPPYLMGGFMGAMPPESTFAPPYMQRPKLLSKIECKKDIFGIFLFPRNDLYSNSYNFCHRWIHTSYGGVSESYDIDLSDGALGSG